MGYELFSKAMHDTANNYTGISTYDLNIYANQPTWDEYFPTKLGNDSYFSMTFGNEEPRSWFDRVPNASWTNAGITIALSAIPSFLDAISSSKIYDLYRTQEQLAIQNAEIQAQRLQRKGAMALANLETKHALTQGKNELALAGAGAGSISGSLLDKLVSNKKYDTREEFAQSLETLYAVDNAKRDGLISAINVAGSAVSSAYNKRNKYISNLLNGVSKAVDSINADVKQTYLQDAKVKSTENEYRKKDDIARMMYRTPSVDVSSSLKINGQEHYFSGGPLFPGISVDLTPDDRSILDEI